MPALIRLAALALSCLATSGCGGVALGSIEGNDAGAAGVVASGGRRPASSGGSAGTSGAVATGGVAVIPSIPGRPPVSPSGGVGAGAAGGAPTAGGATSCAAGEEAVATAGDCYANGVCVPAPDGHWCTSGSGARLCGRNVATGSPTLVDDLADDDALVLPNDGRNGAWFAANDGTAPQFPDGTAPDECAADSGFITTTGQACTYGGGFTSWGGEIGLTLSTGAQPCVFCAYDVSAFTGVRFTLGGTSTVPIRFEVGLLSTVSQLFGGPCVGEGMCWDDYGVELPSSGGTTTYSVRFDELAQRGWGHQVPWSPEQAWALRWVVNGSGFDFCVDDVEFF